MTILYYRVYLFRKIIDDVHRRIKSNKEPKWNPSKKELQQIVVQLREEQEQWRASQHHLDRNPNNQSKIHLTNLDDRGPNTQPKIPLTNIDRSHSFSAYATDIASDS